MRGLCSNWAKEGLRLSRTIWAERPEIYRFEAGSGLNAHPKGTGMSWQGYLAQSNMTEKQLREVLIADAEADRQGLVDSVKEATKAKTKYYKLSNGKMYTSENKGFEGDDIDIEDYELSETTLKIIDKEKGIVTLTRVK